MPLHNRLCLFALLLAGCAPAADRTAAVHIDTLPNNATPGRSDAPKEKVGGDSDLVAPNRGDTLSSHAMHVRNRAPRWNAGDGWKVAQDIEIVSPEDGHGQFDGVGSIVEDALGRIFILDNRDRIIQQYDAGGKWIRTIGRQGSGPGEFQGAIGMALVGRNLVVIDPGNVRVSLFDTSGAYQTSYPRAFSSGSEWGGLDTAGHLYDLRSSVDSDGQRWQLMRLGTDSFAVVDSFPIPDHDPWARLVSKTGGMYQVKSILLPYTPTLSRVFDPRGFVWLGMSNRYEIIKRRFVGDTVRVIERAWTPKPLPDSSRQYQDSMFNDLRLKGFKLPEPAKVIPAFGDFVIDEAGNLWVGPYDSNAKVWDVFTADGEWLGPVSFPEPIQHLSFQRSHYYGVTYDSLDVPRVVRGRVVR